MMPSASWKIATRMRVMRSGRTGEPFRRGCGAATLGRAEGWLSSSELVSLAESLVLTCEEAVTSRCIDDTCPVARSVAILDGRWTMLVIRDLLRGTRRFSELRSSLDGISPKTLTDRLRALEEHGLVERRQYAEIPPRVEYSLTARGAELEPVIEALATWGGGERSLR
ncbi:winged helix-turn-helix transcriptional regulator [Cellulomonas composti]|uniref:winged helix-turn-helix transcriptional regulator n=1 Tax=Cellulomonas composti TaxID=266130 RepID=UPI0027D9BEEC|nr:helix-turn-helix domain-containing protein [Cellulomonas composti]